MSSHYSLNYEAALATVQEQDSAVATGRLRDLRRRADIARERASRATRAFEEAVAVFVSRAPSEDDWYHHQGVLSREEAMEAAKLTSKGLQRLMERYGRRNPRPARRRTRR